MQFNQVIGREKEKAQLRDLVQQNRLSHSLLFLGKDGSAALQMAIAFAQFVMCERVKPKEAQAGPTLFGETEEQETKIIRTDSCGACPACLKVEQLIHPDLHFSYPILKRDSKHDRMISTDFIAEWRRFVLEEPYESVGGWFDFLKNSPSAKIDSAANKQGNITVHECEDILHKFSLKPFESDFKILIMWMPEFLKREGNRLLKLIEEPPPGTLFIFVAEDENEILPTILSRTQLVKIPLPSDVEVEKMLLDRNTPPEQAAQVAAVAAGNIREAINMLENVEDDWLITIRDWLNVTYKNKVELQSKWIDEVNQLGREKQKQLLHYFIYLIELALKINCLGAENSQTISHGERDFAAKLSEECGIYVLEEMAEELDKAMYFIERNANAKMLFHSLTIRFHYLIKEKCLILIH